MISLYAMGSFNEPNHQTMGLLGRHKGRTLHILVDSGSTYNVMDLSLTKGLNCKMNKIAPLQIIVANGEEVRCDYLCKGFTWEMQGEQY